MFVVDFHLHSRYSRATSKDMVPQVMSRFAKLKGIDMLGTGDILHPGYRAELKEILKSKGDGVYEYDGVDYLLTVETSHIYSDGGRVRRVHLVIIFPDFETVEKVAKRLELYGNLEADGRPTFGLSLKEMLELLFDVNEQIIVVPAHIWTPWYSLLGSNSGYDSIKEALGPFFNKVPALETGLSSDPKMNWMVSETHSFTLVSNSDAHSPEKLGREANVFNEPVNFYSLREILFEKDSKRFLFTIEFFPEEGKYHYDGHRACNVKLHPEETRKLNGICPVCGRPVTVGVLNRVYQLKDRPEGFVPEDAIPFKNLVPLKEIMAQVYNTSTGSKRVQGEYQEIVSKLGPELEILLEVPEEDLKRNLNEKLANAILNARKGKVKLEAGYDGVYGKVIVIPDKEEKNSGKMIQGSLF